MEPRHRLSQRLYWRALLPTASALLAALGLLAWSGWLPHTALWAAAAAGGASLALYSLLSQRLVLAPLAGRLATLLRVIQRWSPAQLNKPLAPSNAPVRDELDALIQQLEWLRAELHGELQHLRDTCHPPAQLTTDMDGLMAHIANRFITLPVEHIDSAIISTFAEVGLLLDGDRCLLLLHNAEDQHWSSIELSPHLGRPPCVDLLDPQAVEQLAPLLAELQQGAAVRCDDTQREPLPAAVAPLLQLAPARSLLCLPISHLGKLEGALVLSCISQPRPWRGDEIAALRLLAQVIANALQRKREELASRREEEELREDNQRLAELALLDGLTNLPNRRQFDQVMAAELRRSQRSDSPLSLAIFDIDHFKRYNDHYGHQAGDEALKQVAQLLAVQFRRAGELPARIGGEEFAVVLPHTGDADPAMALEQALAQLRRLEIPHADSPVSPYLSLSAGLVTTHQPRRVTVTSLLKAADDALYRAKHEGRDRCCQAPEEAAWVEGAAGE